MFHAHLVLEDILPSAAPRSQYRFYEIVAGRVGPAEHISGHKAAPDASVTLVDCVRYPVCRPGLPLPGSYRMGTAGRRWGMPRAGGGGAVIVCHSGRRFRGAGVIVGSWGQPATRSAHADAEIRPTDCAW